MRGARRRGDACTELGIGENALAPGVLEWMGGECIVVRHKGIVTVKVKLRRAEESSQVDGGRAITEGANSSAVGDGVGWKGGEGCL